MNDTNAWNEAHRKNIDWAHVRAVYERCPISIRDIARQLKCNRNLVSRRLLREQWRKAPGVPHHESTNQRNLGVIQTRELLESFGI